MSRSVEAERPATGKPRAPPAPARGPDRARKAADLDPAWHIGEIDRALSGTVFLADALPTATVMVGSDVTDTAVLLGGDYDYINGQAIVRSDPAVYEAPVPEFDPGHPLVRELERVYRAVAAYVGRRAFVNSVMTLDAFTTLSLLAGYRPFCLDLLRRPGWVVERTLAVTRLVNAFYEHFYCLLVELGHGESSAWFHTVAEGRFDCLRADAAAMVAPGMFDRCVLPELRLRAAALDHCLFNMDSVRMLRFLPSLARVDGLDGIYWNPEPPHRDLREWLPALRDIRRAGLVLEVEAASVAEACAVAAELGPDGLLVALPRFSSLDAAEDAVVRVRMACAG